MVQYLLYSQIFACLFKKLAMIIYILPKSVRSPSKISESRRLPSHIGIHRF